MLSVQIQTVRLFVRTERPSYVRTFIPRKTCPFQVLIQPLFRVFHKTCLIGVLETDDKLSAGCLCQQVVEESGA